MPILEIERPTRKVIPDPIIATKVSKEIQEAFDKLAVRKYRVTRAELLRAEGIGTFGKLVSALEAASFE